MMERANGKEGEHSAQRIQPIEAPADAIEQTLRKVNFLRDVFSHEDPPGGLLSKQGTQGLTYILGDIETDLESVFEQLSGPTDIRTLIEDARSDGKI